MSRIVFFAGLVLWGCWLSSGCGMGLMQTAKTTPVDKIDVFLGMGCIYNEMSKERGSALSNVSPHVAVRFGLTDQLDAGAALFMGTGGLLDVKYNFQTPESPLAISIQAGLGGAGKADLDNAITLHLPLKMLFSYELLGGWLTPYAMVGIGIFWIFDYKPEHGQDTGVDYADRKGHGDSMLMLTAGLELFTCRRVKLLLEYSFWMPIIDDPGDFFSFVDNHIFMIGMRF